LKIVLLESNINCAGDSLPKYINLRVTAEQLFNLSWGQRSFYLFPGTPASSTTKIGCHDIAEILLKVALKPN
jgi:hypothetical protein